MGYKIRYGPTSRYERTRRYGIKVQIISAAVLLVLLWCAGSFLPGGKTVVEAWFLPTDLGVGEKAVQAMAKCVAAGEGWYQGAVVFCQCLLAA